MTLTHTIIQSVVPDGVRGRVAGIYSMHVGALMASGEPAERLPGRLHRPALLASGVTGAAFIVSVLGEAWRSQIIPRHLHARAAPRAVRFRRRRNRHLPFEGAEHHEDVHLDSLKYLQEGESVAFARGSRGRGEGLLQGAVQRGRASRTAEGRSSEATYSFVAQPVRQRSWGLDRDALSDDDRSGWMVEEPRLVRRPLLEVGAIGWCSVPQERRRAGEALRGALNTR